MAHDQPEITNQLLLRPHARELLRNGKRVHVETRVFDLLLALVNAQGDVVDKDMLVEKVWNGRPVSDDAISAAIRDLRRAVGDDGRRQSVVKTIYGRGVQLVSSIQVEDNARQPVLVVSPFEADVDMKGYASAITLDVTAAITRTRSFAVISHQGALASFAGQKKATSQLGADYALSGRLNAAGTAATLTMLLSDAHSGEAAWADRITQPMEDLIRDFANLADAIAASVETEIIIHAADQAKLRPIDSLDA